MPDGAELMHSSPWLCRGRGSSGGRLAESISTACSSPAASSVLRPPPALPAHCLGLQGSDPGFDIPVIVSSSLSRSLARGQQQKDVTLSQDKPCLSQPLKGESGCGRKNKEAAFFPCFGWQFPCPAQHTHS